MDKDLSKPTDIFLYSDITKGVRDLKDGKVTSSCWIACRPGALPPRRI